jgi:hypothetical protein
MSMVALIVPRLALAGRFSGEYDGTMASVPSEAFRVFS